MNKSHLIGALCAAVFSFITMPSHAALISVLGGQAYYDNVANLTWLADANAAVGSAYDTTSPGTGRMNWDDAKAWAAGLDIDGVTGWRLPTTDPALEGNQSGSEMGNLFYNVLGGVAGTDLLLAHNSNYDLFSNIRPEFYGSSTEYAPNPSRTWAFLFADGYQLDRDKYNGGYGLYAWAVQSGNAGASAVPVPAAIWLFGSGLIGLVGIARKRKAT